MADLRDFTKKNPIFVGTDGVRLPTGTNAQRVASANVAGTMRFNTDIDGIETYTTAGWRPLAAPPSISTVSPSTFSGESGTEFTINGEGFTPDAQVYFVTSNGTSILASTVSYYSAVQVRATTPRAIRVQEEPISVRVVQQSGTTTKTDCIDAGGVPNWITTAGTLGNIFGANTVNVYVSATDPEGTAISYQITSGSLPGGLNFTTANGLIQGLASSVLANTTYNFTIKANDTVSNNTDRSFSYTVLNRAPVINTAAGSLGTIYSGNAASASISAYDPDGGQLTYSVSSGTLPVNSSLGSANGVITGTPVVVTTNTTYSFTLTSTDEGSLTASNNYTYTVLNRPPLINTAAGSLGTIVSGNAISTTIDAYDPDGAAVSFAITSGNLMATANIGSSNGTITASNSLIVLANTTYTFTVRATDVGEMSVSNTYTYTVLNRPPLWNTAATLPSTSAEYSNSITVNAYDPDGGSVTYALTSGSLPSGLSFVSANGTIVGTPPEVDSNTTSTFNINATDIGNDSNTRTFSLTITPLPPDSQFSNTVLLLKTTNVNEQQNQTFLDSSNNNFTVSRFGNATQGTFTPFSQTGWSTYFDGSSDGIVIPSSTFSGNWVNSNFTFEAWVYVTGNGPNGFIWLYGQNNNDCLYLGLSVTDKNINYGSFNGLSFNYSFSTSNNIWEMNKWFHVAWVRNSTGGNTNAMKVFLNGVLVGTGNTGTFGVFDNSFFFNNQYHPWADLDGYCAGLRLSNTALYSTNFTPGRLTNDPTTKVLLCSDKTLQDYSSNKYPLSITGTPSVQAFSPFAPNSAYTTANTGGSMYIGATPDGVKFATPSTQFGASGNYTVSMWYYPTGTTTDYNPLFIFSDNLSSDNPMAGLFFNSGYSLFWLNNGSGGNGFNANQGITIVPFQWNHIVVTRTSGTTRCWTNGTLRVDGWSADSMNADKRVLCVGTNRAGGDATPGYISGFEFLNGTSLYTTSANFTPPTTPPIPVTNTVALLNFTNAGIYDATSKNNIQTVGDAKSNTAISKFGSSMYFDGTGDYLVIPANKFYEFRTSDFTIECWVRLITIGTAKMLVTSNYNAGTGAGGWALIHRADTSSLSLSVNSNVTYTKSWSPTAGIWYHVSVSRSGTNLRFFIDGTQIGTTSTSSDNITGSSTVIVAGNSTSNLPIDANISDLRITRSARYTTNFTAPTRTFPNK